MTNWAETMAREVAPQVNGYTIVTRDNGNRVKVYSGIETRLTMVDLDADGAP